MNPVVRFQRGTASNGFCYPFVIFNICVETTVHIISTPQPFDNEYSLDHKAFEKLLIKLVADFSTTTGKV